jgi:hypothetical protein
MASSVTTLEKVADKVKLEDSGAYRSLMRMSSGVSFVDKYLRNRGISQKKREKVVIKSLGRSKRGVVITTPTSVTSKRARVITRA